MSLDSVLLEVFKTIADLAPTPPKLGTLNQLSDNEIRELVHAQQRAQWRSYETLT